MPDGLSGYVLAGKIMKNKLYTNIAIACSASFGLVLSAAGQNPSTPAPGTKHEEKATAKTDKSSEKSSVSMKDRAFMRDAAKGGMMEVAMGRMAEQNASNADVKKFGAHMVADHGKANSELKSLAKSKGVDLPAEKDAGKWKSDKDYVDMMVKDHEKDLADFEKEAKDGSDAAVKRFAAKTSSVIRKHLEMVKDLQAK
jgi:putative membrane protein